MLQINDKSTVNLQYFVIRMYQKKKKKYKKNEQNEKKAILCITNSNVQ